MIWSEQKMIGSQQETWTLFSAQSLTHGHIEKDTPPWISSIFRQCRKSTCLLLQSTLRSSDVKCLNVLEGRSVLCKCTEVPKTGVPRHQQKDASDLYKPLLPVHHVSGKLGGLQLFSRQGALRALLFPVWVSGSGSAALDHRSILGAQTHLNSLSHKLSWEQQKCGCFVSSQNSLLKALLQHFFQFTKTVSLSLKSETERQSSHASPYLQEHRFSCNIFI